MPWFGLHLKMSNRGGTRHRNSHPLPYQIPHRESTSSSTCSASFDAIGPTVLRRRRRQVRVIAFPVRTRATSGFGALASIIVSRLLIIGKTSNFLRLEARYSLYSIKPSSIFKKMTYHPNRPSMTRMTKLATARFLF